LTKVRLFKVPNRLGELLRSHGGLSRGMALATAERNVEALRDKSVATLLAEIKELELAAPSGGGEISPDALHDMKRRAGTIFNLAGTFAYMPLQTVAASLLDLIDVIEHGQRGSADAIIVHARAARLMAPGAPALPPKAAKELFEHLRSVKVHFEERV
jgi:hypothetical protein